MQTILLEWLKGQFLIAPFERMKLIWELKFLGYELKTIQYIRKVFIFFFLASILCLFWLAGLVSVIVHLFHQVETVGTVSYDPFYLFSLGTFALASLGLWWGFSERRWMNIFGISDKLLLLQHRQLEKEQSKNEHDHGKNDQSKQSEINPSIIGEIISRMIEDKLREKEKKDERESSLGGKSTMSPELIDRQG